MLRSVTILLIEDDPLIQKMYKNAFKFEGYDMLTANDGLEGIELAKSKKPSIILLDIMMPKLNGLDALKILKSDPDTKDIPVVMLTNLADEHDAEGALSKGALKYIVKSEHDPKEIIDVVKDVVAKNG
jgi:two-component system, OmpR family, alkaline phosphatase synthesis response regulator PhoP